MHKYTIRNNCIYYASYIAEPRGTNQRSRGRRPYVLEFLDPNDVIRGSRLAKNPPYGR